MSDDLSQFLKKLEGVLEREARLADQMAELKALREAVEKAEARSNNPQVHTQRARRERQR